MESAEIITNKILSVVGEVDATKKAFIELVLEKWAIEIRIDQSKKDEKIAQSTISDLFGEAE